MAPRSTLDVKGLHHTRCAILLERMTSCTDILVALNFEMEDAKKPPTQRLTVNLQGPCSKIIFYAREVEA